VIDTVQLRHSAPLPPSRVLMDHGFIQRRGHALPDADIVTWVQNFKRAGGVFPRLAWSSTPSGGWLTAEVSLPKMLYSSNVILIDDADVNRGLDVISQFISNETGFTFDAHTALVGRVDYCFNFSVGEENIARYVSAVSCTTLPLMTRRIIEDTTAVFQNESRKVQLYGKQAEVESRWQKGKATDDELQAAPGILRLEVSYRHAKACKSLARRSGLPDHRADHLLVRGIAEAELGKMLTALGLDRIVEAVDTRLDVLRENHGYTSYFRQLVAYLALRDHYGEKFYQQGIGGYSRSSIYRLKRDLKAAGVLLRTEHQLPPLRLA